MDRFSSEWTDLVKFYTKEELFGVANDPITLKDWVYECDNYTRLQLLTRYFSSRRYIFVVEADVLKIQSSNTIEYTVVVRNLFIYLCIFLYVRHRKQSIQTYKMHQGFSYLSLIRQTYMYFIESFNNHQ